ncbi:protein GLUTAMINE DUMPER 6-like [Gastrolobium bilobum]|uniref:protein GLUTAMINE DUMPER 6-like n=1 Tax=Gastrolobium bilobum TaxID=150636 RepID=UPI002AB27EFD|nr:protein GLUTAMINE DUMPER 6-like [Gastrolobium bilobum]
MRPINSVPSSSTSGIKIWKSPIPYLFGGLALMLALISVALVILVCSYKKRSSQSSDAAEDMKQAMPKNIEINSEPEVLVIMAGDDKPTYLAKPISSSNYCTCGAEPTPSSSSTIEQRLTN